MKTTLRNQSVKINIFDMAGDAVFFEVRNEFYEDSTGAILVFDVTKYPTFESLDLWIKEVTSGVGNTQADDMVICVFGNKVDQPTRCVSYYEASQWCARRNLPYFETSALTGLGVTEAFNTLLESMIKPDAQYTEKSHWKRNTHKAEARAAETKGSLDENDPIRLLSSSKTNGSRSPRHTVPGHSKSPRNMSEHQHGTGFTQAQLNAVNRIRNARTNHERLGVTMYASKEDVNRAYRKLAFAVHPDKNFVPGSEEAFKLLVTARNALIQNEPHTMAYKFHQKT
ncbi:DnaJ subfamily C member 27 [Paragonimus westermani]|uniref:DnaJ subfamily C member 27 n=1 Tax=Paragonimus westermani TaxID=34504 RepID=A0A5J4P0P6_9TREM|nr:DnaJ subfamily C member 27 [Paragonimus westermani]